MEESLLLTFESVNFTMMTEKKLLDKEISLRTIPTPREISNSCGLAIKMDYKYRQEIESLMQDLPIKALWKFIKNSDGENIAELLK
ncbi:MAG: DUF3343 domain-containing protein [Tissierellia bacterium]|nr:DUF3343 domain-containing protein [Tissierellia bacterium]